MAPLNPLLRHGIREATGTERPAPGILCWNCQQLTPFPSGSCKWCGAAFAGTAGGAIPDHIPDQTVRAPLSVPSVDPAVRPRRRVVHHLGDPALTLEPTRPATTGAPRGPPPAVGARPRGTGVVSPTEFRRPATSPSGAASLEECPVCGRTPSPGAQGCVCGAVFGDTTTTVNCAECGSVMPIDAERCFVCHIPFSGVGATTYACPLCGAFVDEAASACRCGARFAD